MGGGNLVIQFPQAVPQHVLLIEQMTPKAEESRVDPGLGAWFGR